MTSRLLILATALQASAGLNVSADTDDIAIATLQASVTASLTIPAATANASFGTLDATISVGQFIAATTADIACGVNAAGVAQPLTVSATTANVALGTAAASLGGETSAFLTDFPGYNQGPTSAITNPDTSTPTVTIVPFNSDPTEVIWQQSVTGVSGVSGKTLAVKISTTNKETSSSYDPTYEGPWVSATHDALEWDNIPSYTVSGGYLNFTVVVPPGQTNVYISTVPPLNRNVALKWMQTLQAAYPGYIHDDLPARVRLGAGPFIQGLTPTTKDENGRTFTGLPMYGFRISNDAAGPQAPVAKRLIIFFCGVHTMEFNGWHEMRGAVDQILTGPDSATLLAENVFVIYPLISVPGNEAGTRRQDLVNSTTQAYDPNRYWDDGNGTIPTVAAWQDILDENHGVFLHNCAAMFDWHDATTTGTNGAAYWNYPSGMADLGAIDAIFTALDAELAGVQSAVSGTTNDYFFAKGVKMPITCEIADEQYTLAQIKAIGAKYMTGLAQIIDAGLLDTYDTRALGTFEDYSFETGLEGWVDGGGTQPWTRSNVTTPTANTGPTAAFDGSWFMYTEATGVAASSTFILQKDNVDLSKIAEVQTRFSRHVNGSSLRMDYWDGLAWVQIWLNNTSYSGPTWKNAGGDVSDVTQAAGKIRFVATMPTTNITLNDNGIDFVRFLYFDQTSGLDVSATTANASFGTLQAQVLLGKNITATVADIAVGTKQANANAMVNVQATTAGITITELAASLGQAAPIQTNTASLSLATNQAAIIAPQVIPATTANLALATLPAVVTNAVPARIDGATSKTIGVAYGSVTVYHNGQNYYTL